MNIFDHNSGDFKMIDLENFFEDIQKGAMDSGYELFMTHGISGMQKEMGSKDPISLANKLIQFYIRYEEYEKCGALQKLIEEHRKEYYIKPTKKVYGKKFFRYLKA